MAVSERRCFLVTAMLNWSSKTFTVSFYWDMLSPQLLVMFECTLSLSAVGGQSLDLIKGVHFSEKRKDSAFISIHKDDSVDSQMKPRVQLSAGSVPWVAKIAGSVPFGSWFVRGNMVNNHSIISQRHHVHLHYLHHTSTISAALSSTRVAEFSSAAASSSTSITAPCWQQSQQ